MLASTARQRHCWGMCSTQIITSWRYPEQRHFTPALPRPTLFIRRSNILTSPLSYPASTQRSSSLYELPNATHQQSLRDRVEDEAYEQGALPVWLSVGTVRGCLQRWISKPCNGGLLPLTWT